LYTCDAGKLPLSNALLKSVTVCATASAFVQVTVDPAVTRIVSGTKAKFCMLTLFAGGGVIGFTLLLEQPDKIAIPEITAREREMNVFFIMYCFKIYTIYYKYVSGRDKGCLGEACFLTVYIELTRPFKKKQESRARKQDLSWFLTLAS